MAKKVTVPLGWDTCICFPGRRCIYSPSGQDAVHAAEVLEGWKHLKAGDLSWCSSRKGHLQHLRVVWVEPC